MAGLAPAHDEDVTGSHALAAADHDKKGIAQLDHSSIEAKDVGWNKAPDQIPELVGGLSNDELWTLIRRFDKQMYHVKKISSVPPGDLDLNIAAEEEFSPDKMRSNIERLYMTVILGMIGFGKHFSRLCSWREPRRTAAFCITYFLAWALDFLVPTLLAVLLVLIVSPSSRNILFPPSPLALVNFETGGIQKPKAGMLGSHDSLTGAPEKHQGEAVEREASNFVSGLTSITVSSAVGQHPEITPEQGGDTNDDNVPDPTKIISGATDAKSSAAGEVVRHDKTKQPMEETMWAKARPIMHIVGMIADTWERFANALSPTPPFPKQATRLRFAAFVIPLLAVSIFLSSYIFMKFVTLGVGFGLFGEPLISRAVALLNRIDSHWQELLDIRNTLLKGIPTNAQLTLTLLRIGELNNSPLPPPPTTSAPPASTAASVDTENLATTLDASQDEIEDAIHPSAADESYKEQPSDKGQPRKHRHGRKTLALLKGTTRGGISAFLGADRLKASAGSETSKKRVGVIPSVSTPKAGPVRFPARYQGKRGVLYLSTTATAPCISFTAGDGSGAEGKGEEADGTTGPRLKPVWTVAINDIAELKKVGGLGWKAKLVVGWATDREVADGIEIVEEGGGRKTLTAIRLREQLFNRLVAVGRQKWESW